MYKETTHSRENPVNVPLYVDGVFQKVLYFGQGEMPQDDLSAAYKAGWTNHVEYIPPTEEEEPTTDKPKRRTRKK